MNWVGLVPVCLGLGTIGFSISLHFWRRARLREAARWSQTQAEILESRIEVRKLDGEAGGTFHVPVIRYAYSVGGRGYEGDRLTFSLSEIMDVSKQRAEGMLASYPVGARPIIRYNPANPSESIVNPALLEGIDLGGWFVGLLLIGVGLWFLFGGW